MDKPTTSFLQESDPGKTEVVNPGEYLESAPPVDSDIDSSSSGVGSGAPRGGDFHVVLRATITGGNDERKSKTFPKGLNSVDEVDGRFIVTATTVAGELIEFEILPAHAMLFPI